MGEGGGGGFTVERDGKHAWGLYVCGWDGWESLTGREMSVVLYGDILSLV